MAWRRARSLKVLQGEIWKLYPKTTIWALGDPAHQATWSDHNPNAAGVVCAIDVLGNAGLDLPWFADTITKTDPPALKYVIFNRRIWLPDYGWQPYFGNNPHTTHVHVSVGWGPDGRSTGPYDDPSPWGLTEEEEMSWDESWEKLHIPGQRTTARQSQRWVHKLVWQTDRRTERLETGQAAILAAVKGQDVVAAVEAKLAEHQAAMADQFDDLAEQHEALTGQLADVAELVRQVGSGERDAAAVVDLIAERLDKGRQ